jgi:hypothetical protein
MPKTLVSEGQEEARHRPAKEDRTGDKPVAVAKDEAKRKKMEAAGAEGTAMALVTGLDNMNVNPVGIRSNEGHRSHFACA